MKVFIVFTEYPYEGRTVEGVFSTWASAQKYIDENRKPFSDLDWVIEEVEVKE